MSSRKKPYQKKSFESDGSTSDVSANLFRSMLESPAWTSLTATQQRLYLYCKLQYYGEKTKHDGDNTTFTMPQSKWTRYKLYKPTNAKGFYRDMTELIEHGFISCVTCGAATRTKSIYRFSDEWKKYGQADFSVSPQYITNAARRKRAAKENNTEW